MSRAKRVNPNTTRIVIVAVTVLIAVALSLFLYSVSKAQSVTPTPPTVDPVKPQQVKLQFKTSAGLADPETAGKVKKVRVGTAPAQPTTPAEPGSVTFTPPANLSGNLTVQLLDNDEKPINGQNNQPLTVPLTYAASVSIETPQATASPTPDIAYIEKYNAEVRRNNLVSYWWYHAFIILVFVGLAAAFVGVITRGILFSRATFRTATGLPVGSFRAILAYTLVLFLGFYVLVSLLVVSSFPPPEFLLGIVATVIGFYFGSRSGEEGGLLDSKAGAVRGIVRKGSNPVSGAVVKFKAADGTEPFSRITDLDGRFDLRGAKPGKYKVMAEIKTPPGTGEQDVSVAEGSDQEIEITIKEAGGTNVPPPTQTGTVLGVVKGSDGTVPSPVTVELTEGGVKRPGEVKVDANGQFRIEKVKVGPCEIDAKSGTLSGKTTFVAKAGDNNVEVTVK